MPNIKMTADDQEFIEFIRTATPDKLERFAAELEAACECGQFTDAETISKMCAYVREKAQRIRTSDEVRELCEGTELEGVDPEELIRNIQNKGAVR